MSQSSTHRPWVSFKDLRSRLRFEDVLRYYKIELNRKGEQHTGPCPLPNHTKSRRAPTFSANLERGIFQCFVCRARGNLLEFAALMEGLNPSDGRALRGVALKLQKELLPANTTGDGGAQRPNLGAALINAPMDFALKDLDATHPFFGERGISNETARHFGAGFCTRGAFAGKIAIPLHDTEGHLIGYAGHPVDEPDGTPLAFPVRRERQGKVLEFDPSAFLYNANQISDPVEMLTVIDDVVAVWALHQIGMRDVVAVIGDKVSPRQILVAAGMLAPLGTLHVVTRNDAVGREFVPLAAQQFLTRWLRLTPRGRIDPAEIKRKLS